MQEAIESDYLVPFDGSFRIAEAPTAAPASDGDDKKALKREIRRIAELQRVLAAQDRYALLVVFQAMDAAGKDSTIRHVFSGVNPAGFQVTSFKKPSPHELDHDFLWRTTQRMPERGRIGIFNRSQYEEVLVVRVHPRILESQPLPRRLRERRTIWRERLESIADQEKHLARNGTVIVKFWLHVSPDEQRRRFLARLENPDKRWKFNTADVAERAHWDDYMQACEEALNATSRPWAPWYSIPADDKPQLRLEVARLVRGTLEAMELGYPQPDAATAAEFETLRKLLKSGG